MRVAIQEDAGLTGLLTKAESQCQRLAKELTELSLSTHRAVEVIAVESPIATIDGNSNSIDVTHRQSTECATNATSSSSQESILAVEPGEAAVAPVNRIAGTELDDQLDDGELDTDSHLPDERTDVTDAAELVSNENPWIAVLDNNSGQSYWWNTLTNETTWLGAPKPGIDLRPAQSAIPKLMSLHVDNLSCEDLIDTGSTRDPQDPAMSLSIGKLTYSTSRSVDSRTAAVFKGEKWVVENLTDAVFHTSSLKVEVKNMSMLGYSKGHLGEGEVKLSAVLMNSAKKFVLDSPIDVEIELTHEVKQKQSILFLQANAEEKVIERKGKVKLRLLLVEERKDDI